MPIKKPTTAKHSPEQPAPETLGGLLRSHLVTPGAAGRLARRVGISGAYISRMKYDRVILTSKPIKQCLSAAMGISLARLSNAIAATEKHLTATASKQGRK